MFIKVFDQFLVILEWHILPSRVIVGYMKTQRKPNPMPQKNQSRDNSLNAAKVLEEFRKFEHSPGRGGTFKIQSPFEEAVKSIVKAKAEPKSGKRRQ